MVFTRVARVKTASVENDRKAKGLFRIERAQALMLAANASPVGFDIANQCC